VTQFDHLDPSDLYKIEISKIQDGGGRHLEKSKNRHEIWQWQVDHLVHSDRQSSDWK